MNKKKFVPVAVVVGLLAVAGAASFLGIGKVSFEGYGFGCADEEGLKKEVDLVGKNILFLDEQSTLKRISAKYPCIKDVNFVRQGLKDIKVEVKTRTPLAKIISVNPSTQTTLGDLEAPDASSAALLDWSFPQPAEDSSLVVDELGFIFQALPVNELPLLFFPSELKLGQNLESITFTKLAVIFQKLAVFEFFVSRSKVMDNSLLIDGSPKLVFSLTNDVFRQLASLQLILQEAKINGKMMEVIDLRFDKPVVVYFPKK